MLTVIRTVNRGIRQHDPAIVNVRRLLERENATVIDFPYAVAKSTEYFESKTGIATKKRNNILKLLSGTVNEVNYNHPDDPIVFIDDSSPRSIPSNSSDEGAEPNLIPQYDSSSDDDDDDDDDAGPSIKRRRVGTSNLEMDYNDFVMIVKKHLLKLVAEDDSVAILPCGRNRGRDLITTGDKKVLLRRIWKYAGVDEHIFKDWVRLR